MCPFQLLKYHILIDQTTGGLLSLSSYLQSMAAFVISAGCIKSEAALQQIDLPSSRHENITVASARTGVCVFCSHAFLHAREIILVKEGFSSVCVCGGVCT